tara:strand:- start:39 stop:1766 length:1728 start_codon:yes stop_codon:yes gene_type:complete
MAIEKTIILKADMKEALESLGNVEKSLKDIDETTKKSEKGQSAMAKGFKGVGLAMKAAGFALIMKLVDSVTEALMKNQEIADTVETVFNSIGIVFKMVSDTLISVGKSVLESTDNFDAMQKVITNLIKLSITPFKLAFDGIKLGIQSLQLVWEKSVFGGKGEDIERIAELTASIEDTKASLKGVVTDAIDSGKAIATNLGEAVGEIVTIAGKTTEAFKETFEGVTVNSIIEQGKAITATKKNYELLALAQQRLVEQYDLEAETQRGIRDDIRLTVDERIAANNELGAVLQRQSEAEKAAIQSQIDSVIQLEELEGKTNETKAERFALETELLAIDAKVKGFQAEQLTNEAALQDERITNLQELSDIGKTELDRQINDIEIQAEKKRELARRTITDAKQLQDTLTTIDKDAAKQKEGISRELGRQQRDIVANTLGAVSGLIGEETKAGKALAVGQALINTYSAAAAALAPPPLGAGPIFGPIAAIGAVASGMASVKRILSTKLPDSPDVPSPDLSPPSIPDTPSLQEMNTGGLGGLIPNMNTIQPVSTAPIQAFVVENDISNAQALQEELEIQATL